VGVDPGVVHTVAADWHLWLGFLGASIAIAFSPGAGAIQSLSWLLNRFFSGLFATAAVVLALVRRAATA
jgi:hypothetical protein